MPVVAAVVAVVAGVVGAIASLISGLAVIATIANIIAAVAGAVATIGYLIRYGFRGSILQIASAVFGILGVISRAWKAIESRMWSLFVDYGLRGEYEKADVVLEIIWRMNKIEAVVSSVIQSIFKPLETLFSLIRQSITNALNWVEVRFDDIISNIQRGQTNIITAIASAITQPYRDYANYVEILYTVAKAWDAFGNEKIGAGVYYLLKFFNTRLSDEIRLLVELVDQKVTQVQAFIDTIIKWVKDDLTAIGVFATRQADVLLEIGRIFGAEELVDVAEKIRSFKLNVIDKTVRDLSELRADVKDFITKITHPFRLFVLQYHLARTEDRRIRRMFDFMSIEYLARALTNFPTIRFVPVLRVR